MDTTIEAMNTLAQTRINEAFKAAVRGDDAMHDWITCEYEGADSFLAVARMAGVDPQMIRRTLASATAPTFAHLRSEVHFFVPGSQNVIKNPDGSWSPLYDMGDGE